MIGFYKRGNLNFFLLAIVLLPFLGRLCFSQPLEPKWQTYKYQPFHCSIQSPYLLKGEFTTGEQGELKYSAFDKKMDFSIFLMAASLQGKDENVPLNDIPSKVQKTFVSKTEGSNFKSSYKSVTTSGLPAILTNGTFETKDNITMKIESLDVKFNAKREKLWIEVLLVYSSKNVKNDVVAAEIINSFQILNSKF